MEAREGRWEAGPDGKSGRGRRRCGGSTATVHEIRPVRGHRRWSRQHWRGRDLGVAAAERNYWRPSQNHWGETQLWPSVVLLVEVRETQQRIWGFDAPEETGAAARAERKGGAQAGRSTRGQRRSRRRQKTRVRVYYCYSLFRFCVHVRFGHEDVL
ncbi:putative proline-rich receptor-like protein kinase PERK8 [Iris pallida]|uniref:Proline-rich receptor-like protein kinase PERK8 n=1 Tax=Iris pallida TaxID=29817 RepID=A0AAX6H5K0_IRIPA|nr:putative proline-rich receptor-like protein kinase PERK8 [Iris pallida]